MLSLHHPEDKRWPWQPAHHRGARGEGQSSLHRVVMGERKRAAHPHAGAWKASLYRPKHTTLKWLVTLPRV